MAETVAHMKQNMHKNVGSEIWET